MNVFLRYWGWALIVALLTFAYCGGRAEGKASEQLRSADSVAKVLADSAKVQRRRTVADSTARIVAERHAVASDAARDSALHAFARRVRVVSDTGTGTHRDVVVSVDNGPPTHEVPAELAIPAVQSCASAATSDATLVTQLHAEIADLHGELKTANERADNADLRAKAAHRRFGIKTGFVLGASAALALFHFLK